MEQLREIIHSFFVIDTIWSVVFRGVIWLVLAIVIIMSTDVANPQASNKNLKANLGLFLLFLIISSGLMYLLFGFSSTPGPA